MNADKSVDQHGTSSLSHSRGCLVVLGALMRPSALHRWIYSSYHLDESQNPHYVSCSCSIQSISYGGTLPRVLIVRQTFLHGWYVRDEDLRNCFLRRKLQGVARPLYLLLIVDWRGARNLIPKVRKSSCSRGSSCNPRWSSYELRHGSNWSRMIYIQDSGRL